MDQNTAIEELHKLGAEVDSVTELGSLKPIYFRLDQIAKKFPDDFDVQVVVSELKQRLVTHGQKLKDSALGSTGIVATSMASAERLAAAPPPPPTPSAAPTSRPPIPSGQQPSVPTMPPPPPSGMPGFDSNPANSIPTGFVQTPPTAAVATPPSMQARVPGTSGPTSFQSSVGTIPPPQKPVGSAPNLKRTLLVGAGIGFVAFAGLAFLFVQLARNKNFDKDKQGGGSAPAAGKVMVEFTTTPAGATIQVSGSDRQEKCVSNCKIELVPGSYQVTATLDGYNPSASGVVVDAGNPTPPPVVLPLTPVAQSVKIVSDVAGKVLLDGKPAGDLQEGQFIFDRIPLGSHTVTVQSTGADATFSFTAEAGKAPVVTSPATAKNLLALLVATAGNQAKVYTSNAVKVKVDGQDRGEVSGAGTDLTGLSPGEHDLEAGEGKDLKKLVVSVGEMPMLTAYLKSDVNAGFLVVVAGQEDDVAVSIEGRAYPRKTQRGQLRVQLPPGKYRIKAAKDGFDASAEQTAEIKKGEEAKIAFVLKAQPRVAQLKVSGATPGATVSMDRAPIGKIGNDGTFSAAVTQLGDKVIEFSLAGYSTRQTQRTFKAGETITLTNEGLLSPAASNVRLVVSPPFPEIKVTMRREGDPVKNITETNLANLVPGNYLFTASAKGYVERVERFTLPPGEIRTLDLTLKKEVVVSKDTGPRIGTINDLEGNFTRDGDAYVHKGPAVVMFRPPQTNGTFQFTIRAVKGKKLRWVVGRKDDRNQALFELEKNKLIRKDGNNKKLAESAKFDSQDVFQVRLAVSNGALVHSINIGGNWTVVDNWQDAARNFADGRFGFFLDSRGDEIAISSFSFTPR